MNTGDIVLAKDLLVDKKNLRNMRFDSNAILKKAPLGQDEVLLKIDQFAFTSNNITYAAVGDTMQYWDFFPAEEGWGRIPCWGFADVIASNCQPVKAGERIYGYFPMSTHLKVRAGHVNDAGFYDISEHRRALPVIYNHYSRTVNDPSYSAAFEGHHSLFQPLFATSFLLDDYISEAGFFEAKNIILTSASSKTAIALAYLLKNSDRRNAKGYKITGLTSTRNTEFVESLDLYDAVTSYRNLDHLIKENSIVIDFAGNKPLLIELQNHLSDSLLRMIMVGLSHWEDSSGEGHLQVENEFFFAPAQAEKRTAQWGGAGLRKKMGASYVPFIKETGRWLKICKGHGTTAAESVYSDMVNGKINPKEGWIISLHEKST